MPPYIQQKKGGCPTIKSRTSPKKKNGKNYYDTFLYDFFVEYLFAKMDYATTFLAITTPSSAISFVAYT